MANYGIPWNKGKGQSEEIKRVKRSEYYQSRKEIILKKERNRRLANPEKYKEKGKWAALKFKYGISKEKYFFLFSIQYGMCAICRTRKAEVVDHDHITNKVRGLLCNGCNRDMFIIDNPDRMELCKKYKYESY